MIQTSEVKVRLAHVCFSPCRGRNVRSFRFMDFIDQLLEKLKSWAKRLVEALIGPDVAPEGELIPIPVEDRLYR